MPPPDPGTGFPDRQQLKERHELGYWREVLAPILADPAKAEDMGKWYEFFYTDFFGLSRSDYAGRRVLDIGCGPMGPLEWATMARERVGLDPLAPQYLELVQHRHRMHYCPAPAEHIPYADGYFDQVSTFNSLDHVEDVSQAIAEIKRVTRRDGRILLIVEVDHDPTETEPHRLDRNIAGRFAPEFRPADLRLFGVYDQFDLYGALKKNQPYEPGKPGLLACRFQGQA